jgi:ubiquinone/menaquinone biosynthesis C-methylase UbiE
MDNRRYYDGISTGFSRRETFQYHRFLNDLSGDILKKWLPRGRILDAGCGSGHLATRIADGTRTVTGLDMSHRMLSCFSIAPPRLLVQGAIERLPFAAETFDGAYALRVFPHLRNPAAALDELARVVRPGGTVVVDIYNPVSIRAAVKTCARITGMIFPKKRQLEADAARILNNSQVCGRKNHADEPLFTRYDTIRSFRGKIPSRLEYRAFYGIRILTPAGRLLDTPAIGNLLTGLEYAASGSVLNIFGGFLLLVMQKRFTLSDTVPNSGS